MPTEAPLGAWQSPISSELITLKTVMLSVASYGVSGDLFWLELRPSEGGRQVLVRRTSGGKQSDVTPGVDSGFNVRSRVQEYGGGEYLVLDDFVVFTNFKDQVVYTQSLGPDGVGEPQALTQAHEGKRFADFAWHAPSRHLLAVCEDHTGGGEAVTTVAAIDVASGALHTISSGADFYQSVRVSPDGRRVAWVQWQHPNMPWDATELWVADLDDTAGASNPRKVAGEDGESVQQPVWGADADTLYFVTDRSGWWNIHVEEAGKVRPVLAAETEFGIPSWMIGASSYIRLPGGFLLAAFSDPKRAGARLGLVDTSTGALTEVPAWATSFDSKRALSAVQVGDELYVSTVGASPAQCAQVIELRVAGGAAELASVASTDWRTYRRAFDTQLDAGYLSTPEAVAYSSAGGRTAYLNFYPPANRDFALPPGVLSPLLVLVHGGPTAAAGTALALSLQYWTSRGFAVADVNYAGSTGYGRAYRKSLYGEWGVRDVEDCAAAVRHLAAAGRVDPKRACIAGGSAGGYTVMACLAFTDAFSAGTSNYGVADLALLAAHTHKFESRYLDNLCPPALYPERSPINHKDNITVPLCLFQGADDRVVPLEQAQLMHSALKAAGRVTSLTVFDGEQHGFRNAVNIRRALDGQLYFYGRALGFDAPMPPDLEPIVIDNL